MHFKMMIALDEGKLDLGKYDWILGNRPRRWMEQKPSFYLKYAQNVRGFHTYVPKYAQLPGHKLEEAATNYSCGHVAADYVCRIMKATEVHMYGFSGWRKHSKVRQAKYHYFDNVTGVTNVHSFDLSLRIYQELAKHYRLFVHT